MQLELGGDVWSFLRWNNSCHKDLLQTNKMIVTSSIPTYIKIYFKQYNSFCEGYWTDTIQSYIITKEKMAKITSKTHTLGHNPVKLYYLFCVNYWDTSFLHMCFHMERPTVLRARPEMLFRCPWVWVPAPPGRPGPVPAGHAAADAPWWTPAAHASLPAKLCRTSAVRSAGSACTRGGKK